MALAGTNGCLTLQNEPAQDWQKNGGKGCFCATLCRLTTEVMNAVKLLRESGIVRDSVRKNRWAGVRTMEGASMRRRVKIFPWDGNSTYVKRPPYFEGHAATGAAVEKLHGPGAAMLGIRFHHRSHFSRRFHPALKARPANT
jgi:hypothetical protein